MDMTERRARMVLSGVKGVGPITLRKQLERLGELKGVFDLTVDELYQSGWGRLGSSIHRDIRTMNFSQYESRLQKLGVCYIQEADEKYPPNLKHLRDAPLGLYFKGPPNADWKPGIAIVGTRMPSGYGRKQTSSFVDEFVRSGFQIISGLALGIDSMAHRRAIELGGITSGVLGNGLDIVYPRENGDLYEKVKQSGGIWSEFPLGRRADRQSFPQRNRLVAAMAEAVVVIESGSKGGSLITARFAAELGKSVYVLPGRVDSPASEGCHALIRDGATLVSGPEDVLQDLEQIPLPLRSSWSELSKVSRSVSKEAERIIEYIQSEGPCFPDQLSEALEIPIQSLSQELICLEIDGLLGKELSGKLDLL